VEKISAGAFAIKLRQALVKNLRREHLAPAATRALQRFQSEIATKSVRVAKEGVKEVQDKVDQLMMPEYFATSRNGVLGRVDVLPQGTRLFFETYQSHNQLANDIYVVEQPPGIRTVGARGKIARKSSQQYRLSFPYVNLVIVASRVIQNSRDEKDGGDPREYPGLSTFVYYNKRPIQSIDDRVYKTNLPNVYHANNICMGNFAVTPGDSVTQCIEKLTAAFWGFAFNSDITESYKEVKQLDKRIKTLGLWEKSSQANPLFMLDVDFPVAGTIRKIVTDHLTNIDPNFKKLTSVASKLEGRQQDLKEVAQALLEGKVGQETGNTVPLIRAALLDTLESQAGRQIRTLAANIAKELEETVDEKQLAALQNAILTAVEKI
tara:strand:+ start:760 stop:1893 length:1134 start_codon:yes stop_codon:yes gene_type:complete